MSTRSKVRTTSLAAMLILVVVLAGCQPADQPSSEAASEAADQPSSEAATEESSEAGRPGTQGSEPDVTVGGPDVPADGICTVAELDEITATIAGQLDAFAAGEFADALAFTTPSFRAAFTTAEFEAMITSTFPIPATATAHQILDCVRLVGGAAATVRISGAGGQQDYTYAVQLLEVGWRIDGAVPIGGIEPPAEVVQTGVARSGITTA